MLQSSKNALVFRPEPSDNSGRQERFLPAVYMILLVLL